MFIKMIVTTKAASTISRTINLKQSFPRNFF